MHAAAHHEETRTKAALLQRVDVKRLRNQRVCRRDLLELNEQIVRSVGVDR